MRRVGRMIGFRFMSTAHDQTHETPTPESIGSLESLEQAIGAIRAGVQQQHELAAQGFQSLAMQLDAAMQQLQTMAADLAQQQTAAASPPVAEPVPTAIPVEAAITSFPGVNTGAAGSAGSDLENMLFGQDLAAGEYLAIERSALLQGLAVSGAEAVNLAGQILVFRSAPADKLAQLLRDVGEAYYRWRPETAHGEDRLREALVGWLHARCETAGVRNKIELVRPGDRYDTKRHNAKDRGVEIASIGGWIVLRENGSVYTKAAVTVR